MKASRPFVAAALVLLGAVAFGQKGKAPAAPGKPTVSGAVALVKLPAPEKKGTVSVEEALWQRRSVRRYAAAPLELAEVGQLLWAAYGVNRENGYRTAPSAGATYPLELYIVAGNVNDLKPGVYAYRPATHELRLVERGDKRAALSGAALGQAAVRDAPAALVWSAVFKRTTQRYGDRGRERYVCMDLGHSAENVYLQCAALGLGTVAVGAFGDGPVKRVMSLPEGEEPLYIMPVGRLADEKK